MSRQQNKESRKERRTPKASSANPKKQKQMPNSKQSKLPPKRPDEKKLPRDVQKAVKEARARAEAARKQKGISAQQTIPYLRMLPSGICQVTETFYSKLISFQDISYRLATEDVQDAILRGWHAFLNSFSPDISYQLIFENCSTSAQQLAELICIPKTTENLEQIRQEFSDMLKNKAAKGNNGLRRLKYIAFGMEEKDGTEVSTRLDTIERGLCAGLRNLGASPRAVDGKEYLEVLHSILHLDTKEQFRVIDVRDWIFDDDSTGEVLGY